MKVGVFAPIQSPHCDREYLRVVGVETEAQGYHSLWLGEHVVLFDEYGSSYPYASDGKIPVAGERALLEPFTTLGFLAAVTERIRLGTGICLVPQRNPVYTAKETANIDWISNGRLDFGVGIGWLEEEFAALDMPYARRAARCRSFLEVIKRLWCDELSMYEDEFYTLAPCRQYPKPVQSPHPPIHFGGESDAALRRVADLGQGWYGFNLSPTAFAERVRRLDELLQARGRSLDEVEITVSPYMHPVQPDDLPRYAEAGADQIVLMVLAGEASRYTARLEAATREFLEPAAAL